MKVGYVVKRYPRYSETFIVNEILAHEAAGLEVEIFALRPPSDTHFQDVIARVRAPVTYIPRRPASASGFWEALRKAHAEDAGSFDFEELSREDNATVYQSLVLADEVRARGVDHMHAHFGTVSTTIARLTSQLTGVPYTFTAHAKDIFHESVVQEDLDRKLRDARRVVTVSQFNVDYLNERYPVATEKVVRIYNGLDLTNFSYESPRERPPLILAVGRLVEKKGFGDLLDACAELSRLGRDFKCQIVGHGELEADLRAQVDSLGIGNVAELTGARPQNEVMSLMRQAATLAVPCVIGEDGNRDGLPTVLLEAMALGTPCISTNVTGIPEVIRHEDTGLVVPQNDPKSLAQALDRLLAEADTRVRLAERARTLIEAQFDVHVNAGRMRQAFSGTPTAGQGAADQ